MPAEKNIRPTGPDWSFRRESADLPMPDDIGKVFAIRSERLADLGVDGKNGIQIHI